MDRLNLVHSPRFPIETYRKFLDEASIESTSVDTLENFASTAGFMSVVLVDEQLANHGKTMGPADSLVALVGVGLDGPEWLTDERIYIHLPDQPPAIILLDAVKRAYQHLVDEHRNRELENQLRDRSQELEELSRIGIALSTMRDHNSLLRLILAKARELTRSDAGSLYLLDDIPGEGKVLRWKLAQNDSIPVDFEEKILPITKKSLAGWVALVGEPLVIDDAYLLPADAEYTINRSFDLATGYRTKSLLVIPMTNHVGEIIGILQLINRKKPTAPPKLTAVDVETQVIPFDEHTIRLVRSLGGQAAVAVENNILYDSIERLFEGFVTASVTAIEQRDPTTSGHSFRVADLTVELAKTVDGIDGGRFANVRFSLEQLREIRYASLLHDFGKVGVREKVLVKEKKLYPLQIDLVRYRFEYAMKAIEADFARRKLDYLLKQDPAGFEEETRKFDQEMAEELAKLEKDFEFIAKSNEPTVLPEGDFQYLQMLADREYVDFRGQRRKLLTPEEAKTLSIRKGNLDPSERGEIESHVTHTFHFLSKIPWTKDLRSVPNIAYAHHEKLNGRGYPRGLPAEEIPLQSRMMTVSDIYDALTANDRPYKRAVPTERALDILQMETKDGLLDAGVVNIFIEAKVFQRAGVLRTDTAKM
ncbi:MAG TPA: HD domain-containing phosphohydrolase [Thermoanaerobaculia bacterium]